MEFLDETTSFLKDDNIQKQKSVNIVNTSFQVLKDESAFDDPRISAIPRKTYITEHFKEYEKKTNINTQIHNFKWILNLYFAVFTFQLYIPQIIVHVIKSQLNLYSFFKKHIWFYGIFVPCFFIIILTVYLLRKTILKHKKIGMTIPFFIFYLLLVNVIFTFTACYSVKFILSLTSIILGTFLILFLFQIIECLDSKPFISMIVAYSYIVIFFIFYAIFIHQNLVLLFICLVFFCGFVAYDIFQFKEIIQEFFTEHKIDLEKDMTILLYTFAVMFTNIDMFVCCFKK